MSVRSSFGLCSVLALVFVVSTLGCSGKKDAPKADADHGHADHHEEHGEGPHGGTIVEWADGKYHLEFTVDHDKKEATVYVLDGDVKNAAPIATGSLMLEIDEPVTSVELLAMPLDGEPAGSASRFVGKHDNIGIVREYSGSIEGTVDGKPMAGDFKEEPHK